MNPLPILNLYTHIQQVDFKKLLNGRNFAVLQGQLIFEKDGEVFMTVIDEDRDDFTVEDYMALPENSPFELINGKLVYMPSPKLNHQNISINLSSFLNFHVKKNKLGQVLAAPMDVHFSEDNIYQPDILFVSNNRALILKDYVMGAPDFIVEIMSPGTRKKDEDDKLKTYGKYNVLEYWLIDPYDETIEVFLNEDGNLISQQKYEKNAVVTSEVVDGFSIELIEIFE